TAPSVGTPPPIERGSVTPDGPRPDWQVVVQTAKEGVPGYVQIVDPRAPTEAVRSPTVESLRAAGYEVPDFSRLPEGRYTWQEAAAKSAAGEKPIPSGELPIPEPTTRTTPEATRQPRAKAT